MERTRTRAAVMSSRPRLMPALGTWASFLTFSGQGVRNIVGWTLFGVIAAISTVILLVVFLREGHRVPLRALPPVACAYTVLCVLSLAWSQFPAETALAAALMVTTSAVGILLACSLSLRELTVALGRALEATIALGSPKREGPARVLRVPAPYSSASILVTAVVRSRSRAARTSRATALSPTTGSPTRRRTTGARSSLSQAGPFGLLCRAATGQVSHAHPTGRSHREVTSDPRTTIVPHARVVYRSAGAYIWSIRADGCP